jgi:hypothetical protein
MDTAGAVLYADGVLVSGASSVHLLRSVQLAERQREIESRQEFSPA